MSVAIVRTLVVSCTLSIGAFGCGTQLSGPPTGASGTSARQTCYGFGYNDVAIDFIYNVASADRDAGFTESEAISDAVAGCRGDFGGGCTENPNIGPSFTLQECIFGCSACIAAVAADVWR